MQLGTPTMTSINIANARRPWRSVDSYGSEQDRRIFRKFLDPENYDQNEIEMCLNCPFSDCDGNMRKCSHYRYSYLARVKKRK